MEITLYSLSDYNNGVLISKAFDLDYIDTESEFNEAIEEWLEEVTEEKNDGETREEWIVADYEDVPPFYVGEYGLDCAFWDFKEACKNYPHEVVAAAVELDIDLGQIDDLYVGVWESFSQYVEETFYDLYLASGQHDEIDTYLDWGAIERDWGYDHSYTGAYGSCHVFRNH